MPASRYLSIIIMVFMSSTLRAEFKFLFGDKPRVLEVNAFEKTLLSFPSPALTQNCHPGRVVALDVLERLEEATQIVPQTSGVSFMEKIRAASQVESGLRKSDQSERGDEVARLLRLTPLRQSGSTTCAIKLVTGDTVMVTFVLSATVQRPVVEFENISSASSPAKISAKLGGINIFRDLLSGGDLTYLIDITPVFGRSHNTENAKYKLSYLGTDNENVRAWRLHGEAKTSFEAPLFLDAPMGQLLFSAWKSSDRQNPRKLEQGMGFSLYLLTTADIQIEEVLIKLP